MAQRLTVTLSFLLGLSMSTIGPSLRAAEPSSLVASHLRHLIEQGTDRYGKQHSPRWMAALDLTTMRYPDDPLPKAGRRAYRDIHAPQGSNIYLDAPTLVAAVRLSAVIGEQRYADAARAYIEEFLQGGQSRSGLLRWGHHHYYDAFADRHRGFNQGKNNGSRHELRPWCPPWELLAAVDPQATDRALQALVFHLHEPSGAFDRHAVLGGYDRPPEDCTFLEAGAVLAESFCYLGQRRDEDRWVDLALDVARWSFKHRDPDTGLLSNNPTKKRWDQQVCTSEIGVWARALLRSHALSGRQEFRELADAALRAWLQHAWLPDERRYAGMVDLPTGRPVHHPGPYRPARLSDIWNNAFPAHDYPLPLAECCVVFYEQTGAPVYREAIQRWADIIADSPVPTAAEEGYGPYAEVFGRAIHFLLRAHEATDEDAYRRQAEAMAEQAVALLFDGRMFRGHAGEERYDATGGVGWLLLALLHLETGACSEDSCLHF